MTTLILSLNVKISNITDWSGAGGSGRSCRSEELEHSTETNTDTTDTGDGEIILLVVGGELLRLTDSPD